ncbi:Ropporin-1-like protein [Armadillidium vulgare]|nr:Ropporin-1-like protein [Armadillidium vulgare]
MVVEVPAENGRVPAALPAILKTYTKAAIRTQPGDLVSWSFAYFDSLLQGDSPPVKEHIEYPMPETENGITPGLLRVMNKKFSSMETVPRDAFEDLCQALGVRDLAMTESWDAAGGGEEANWDDLLINLIFKEAKTPEEQLSYLMKSISEDPLSKEVPVETVLVYFNLMHTDDDPEMVQIHEEVKEYLSDVASYQNNNLYPTDLTRPSCPLTKLNGE